MSKNKKRTKKQKKRLRKMEKAVQTLEQQLQPIIKKEEKRTSILKWHSLLFGGLVKFLIYVLKDLPVKELLTLAFGSKLGF